MPNGGPDNCGNCTLNLAVQQLGLVYGKSVEQARTFEERSYCTLRKVPIEHSFWTYCRNFTHGPPRTDTLAHGPIFASGLYEGYVRIPWHGASPPMSHVPAECGVCGRHVSKGIQLNLGETGQPLGFCTNRHYIEWWKSQHDDESITPSGLQSPEQYLKENADPADDSQRYLHDPTYGVVVDFLRGKRPDWAGRWLADLRRWSDEQLEDDHHYIQWLFPLTTESEAVFAPRLREWEVGEFRSDPAIRAEVLASFRQLAGLYGFEIRSTLEGIQVVPSPYLARRCVTWMQPDNHNYRRISRVLGSLRLASLDEYARAFLDALERVYDTPAGRSNIGSVALMYWRRRTTEPLR